MLEFVDADYTFVNEAAGRHYGIAGVSRATSFAESRWPATPARRRAHAGRVLTVTSNPTRTSPVKRGKWVLENILGAPPPAPPPNVPMSEDGGPL